MPSNRDIMLMAQQMIRANKNRIPNTPWAKAAVDAIMNGNAENGKQIANNLCSSFGMSRDQAVNEAIRSLKFPGF